jgi:hypothetical protein
MKENTKSILFVAAAAAIALAAWVSRPQLAGVDPQADMTGELLFAEFKDPLQPTSLEIVQYDESTGQVRPFKVAQVKGRWSIPSHSSYPTDAKDQLVDAATSLMNLKVLSIASKDSGDHELYGVVDPTSKDLIAGATGVGTRVTMRDKDDKPVLALIVGKEVADKKELRFVRVAEQDPVYVVKIGTDKLSTRFGDWIEKDLLKMNTWDIKALDIMDYSLDRLQETVSERGRMALDYNETADPKWKLTEDIAIEKDKPVKQTLKPDEELNAKKLDDLKLALGDLKIVDVSRKPEGISANLRASGALKTNSQTAQSLGSKGFYFVPAGDNQVELLSSEGELHVTMKDGIRYVLRFGQIAGGGEKKDAKKEADKKDTDKDGHKHGGEKADGVNRYLLVMAQFDKDSPEKPKLEPLPQEPKPEEAKAEAKKDEKKADEKKDDKAKKDSGKKDDAKKGDSKKAEPAKPDLKAERERIEKANKQKQDEYDAKLKAGEKQAKELNSRFADWYYVISDDVYQKIHLGRKDIVQKKEKKEAEKKDGLPVTDAHAGHDHADAGHDHDGDKDHAAEKSKPADDKPATDSPKDEAETSKTK